MAPEPIFIPRKCRFHLGFSLVDDTKAIVQTMLRLYPIDHLRVEYLRFDTQLMQNTDIKGTEYQQGTLQGWQIRHYIFARDHWQCQ